MAIFFESTLLHYVRPIEACAYRVRKTAAMYPKLQTLKLISEPGPCGSLGSINNLTNQ